MQQHGGKIFLLHTCSINLCQRGKGSEFFNKLFCQKHKFFAIDYQENTTLCLLQPKNLGRKYFARTTGASFLSDL